MDFTIITKLIVATEGLLASVNALALQKIKVLSLNGFHILNYSDKKDLKGIINDSKCGWDGPSLNRFLCKMVKERPLLFILKIFFILLKISVKSSFNDDKI